METKNAYRRFAGYIDIVLLQCVNVYTVGSYCYSIQEIKNSTCQTNNFNTPVNVA